MVIDDPAVLAEVRVAMAAFRPAAGPARRLERTAVTGFGRDYATASTLFRREGAPGRVGRRTQSWTRLPEG